MVRVKVISRDARSYTAERKGDLIPVHRNLDPSIHPFERARAYTRALNATKLDRVFAKPFIANLEGHSDTVSCLARHPRVLGAMISGSADGEYRVWDLSSRTCIQSVERAHNGFVRGLCVSPIDDTLLTCGDDLTVKIWKLDLSQGISSIQEPIRIFNASSALRGIDHCYAGSTFATVGDGLSVWDEVRADPISTFRWGSETVLSCKFNDSEHDLIVATASDRSLMLYDVRSNSEVRKMVMKMRPNVAKWNPQNPFMFTTANEDHNLYSFDMRNLKEAVHIHMDHVSAVLDLDFSPTGKEFVSGSYDCSVRIFPVDAGRSREVYFTKRMQRVFCVSFSGDSRYVVSGSDDMNLRLWKAQASAPLRPLKPAERRDLNLKTQLKKKFQFVDEIKRISSQRRVPKSIRVAHHTKEIIKKSKQRKLTNLQKNRRRPPRKQKEREKHIVEILE